MLNEMSCTFPQGNCAVLQEIPTGLGNVTLRTVCIGAHICNCPGKWGEVLSFLEASMDPEERRLRYFCGGANIRTKEEKTKPGYWRVIGAFTPGEELVGLCFIGVNRVRVRGEGPYTKLGDTTTVDLAYVINPKFRKLGLVQHFTEVAIALCKKHFVGTSIEVVALRENRPMVRAMQRMGDVHYLEDMAEVTIKLREKSWLDIAIDYISTVAGTEHSYATLPLRRISDAYGQYLKTKKT